MIILPWPSAILSPNSRVHWRPRSKKVKAHRATAYYTALEAGVSIPGAGEIEVVITAHPPDKSRRDRDNLLSQCKAYLDGVAQALQIDDSRFDPKVRWGDVVPKGQIVIEVRAIPTAQSQARQGSL